MSRVKLTGLPVVCVVLIAALFSATCSAKDIVTVAGTPQHTEENPGISPTDLVVSSEGDEIYFIDRGTRIQKLSNNQVVTVAGATKTDVCEPDGPALETNISPSSLKLHPRTGEIYFVDHHRVIRKVAENEIVTVAGKAPDDNLVTSFLENAGEDNDGPAGDVMISPTAIDFHPESGVLHFIDDQRRIRMVVNGNVVTLAGAVRNATRNMHDGDSLKRFITPISYVFHPQNNEIVFIDNRQLIRKVVDDQIVTIAGHIGARPVKNAQSSSDGRIDQHINPRVLAVHPATGNIYFLDKNTRIRTIENDQITTIAGYIGAYLHGLADADGPANERGIHTDSFLMHPVSGAIYFTDNSRRIRSVSNGQLHTIAGKTVFHSYNKLSPDGHTDEVDIHPTSMGLHPMTDEVFFVDQFKLIRKIGQ